MLVIAEKIVDPVWYCWGSPAIYTSTALCRDGSYSTENNPTIKHGSSSTIGSRQSCIIPLFEPALVLGVKILLFYILHQQGNFTSSEANVKICVKWINKIFSVLIGLWNSIVSTRIQHFISIKKIIYYLKMIDEPDGKNVKQQKPLWLISLGLGCKVSLSSSSII